MANYTKQVDKAVYELIADKLIEVYISWENSSDSDAGWHGTNALQMAVEFGGCPPPPSGNDQADLKMMYEYGFLKNPHALLDLAKSYIHRIKEIYRRPMIDCHRKRGTFEWASGKKWTVARMADRMGLTVDQYRERVKKGRRLLIDEIAKCDSERAAA